MVILTKISSSDIAIIYSKRVKNEHLTLVPRLCTCSGEGGNAIPRRSASCELNVERLGMYSQAELGNKLAGGMKFKTKLLGSIDVQINYCLIQSKECHPEPFTVLLGANKLREGSLMR